MKIPLVDLRAQHESISKEIEKAIQAVVSRGDFVLGDEVSRFEEEYAGFVGTQSCIGVANGTDALELALRAAGIGPDEEVILPANSFIASALAVLRAGAKPVLVDVDPVHLLIDPAAVESALGSATRAIMPVHLYGQIAPMERLGKIAADAGVMLIEDAAQAQGATQKGVHAGNFGVVSGTSFYPGKNLGAYGDAGAVLTNSEVFRDRLRALRNYGSEVKYQHDVVGFNSRLDTIQAAILRVKLRHLPDWNARRGEAADYYSELLSSSGVTVPGVMEGNQHIWHIYSVRVADRDSVLQKLHASGIGAAIHYPIPIHLQGAMSSLGYTRGDFPVTEMAANEILSLPLYPAITRSQQEQVVEALLQAISA